MTLRLATATLLLATIATLATAASPLAPLSDFGKKCSSGADCQSGVCGYSCSARDLTPFATTSCICACNDVDKDGPCCCGCMTRAVPATVTTCPAGDAQAEGPTKAPLRTLPAGDADALYPRLIEAGALEDEAVQWGDAAGATKKIKYDGSLFPGGKAFGEVCATNTECALGICGTGCDCDSSLEKTCSCNAQSHFPVSTCGGCVRGKTTAIGPCPKGVGIEATGTMVWVPSSPTARVSPAYCTVLKLAARGPYAAAVPSYPAACGVGANAAVGAAFNGANFTDAASVGALYDTLVKLLCSWTPPDGKRLTECKGAAKAGQPAAPAWPGKHADKHWKPK